MNRSFSGIEEPLNLANRQMHSKAKGIFGLAIKPDKGVWEGQPFRFCARRSSVFARNRRPEGAAEGWEN
jgi:hypothetical protein